ncbi:MAG: RNA polymerase sigma factor [Ginsengibacter sp.]
MQPFASPCIILSMTQSDEEQLIKEAQKNNQGFVKLYDIHYAKIFGYIFRRTLDLERTKDITSETFLKAYINIGKFQWKNIPFSAWLYRIATNEMNMADRTKTFKPDSYHDLREQGLLEIADPQSLESEKLIMENQLQQSKDFIQVQEKLKHLAVKYQEVIALRYYEEKSVKEIADILRKKEGTVKSLLSRGIDKLKILF